jgi:type 1 fimbria pilin
MKFTKLMIMCVILAIWFGNVDTKTWAQNASTGTVTGTVSDSTRAVVPGAEVTVVNEGIGQVRKVTTGTAGTYLVPLLPPGSYRVEVSKSGFKLAVRPGIAVVVAEAVGLDVQLEVGSTKETVVVQAVASQVQTESAELGTVTDSRMISDLPLVSRNYLLT